MTEYHVTWAIEVEADSPAEAAEKARRYAVKEDTTATVFAVHEKWEERGGIDDGPIWKRLAEFDVRSAPSFPHFKAIPKAEADELEDDGPLCPVEDPDCVGGDDQNHDACEPPADPLGLAQCVHTDCGRYYDAGAQRLMCRAMKENACFHRLHAGKGQWTEDGATLMARVEQGE
jgi:hypothetical protein